MNPDLVLPLVTSVGWLALVMSALASHRLGWGQMIKMALAWVVIFAGIFMVVEWFLYLKGTGSSPV
jgi:hypothetical protein